MYSMPRRDSKYTNAWVRITGIVRAQRRPCHLCGYPIDYTLPPRHRLSFSCDHILSLKLGGTNVLANAAAAHLACNSRKGDGTRRIRRQLVVLQTSRRW
jgi:5-methylcytosine-specific restriction endonuclease McrA